MTPEEIWEYYKSLASYIGTDKDGNVQGYSVSWFYTDDAYDALNALTRAFIGDADAKEHLHLASEEELARLSAEARRICGEKPYPAQIEAISQAVLNDITIIQGPPGTGKTETIKNLLLCLRELRPEAKIAVISANSEAINNAEDTVKKEARLSGSYARLGNRTVRKEFKSDLDKENPEIAQHLEPCGDENEWQFPAALLDVYPIIFSTVHSLRKCVDIDEYDYVIVDECSQVPSMIGMLAIATAKHLVLLGDDEQLPPIHKERETNTIQGEEQIRTEQPWFLDEKDNSFMKACKASLGERCRSILLNEHHRCHPAIIGFCNERIYGDQLIIRTTDDGKLPIRIRWYEGDYWERVAEKWENKRVGSEQKKVRNYNRKQIEVFVQDEYPEICSILRDDHNYSICVLSPYRAQLEELQKRLRSIQVTDEIDVENEIETIEEGVNDIPQLTIHKAQGRGYDRVYILPVQDTCANPWSQKKEMINVAVSRAKRELCVITSSAWMSPETQMKLCGYVVPRGTGSGDYYLSDLVQYVEREQKHRDTEGRYGLQKSSVCSVFDGTLYYRVKYRSPDEKDADAPIGKMSAPEHCVWDALRKCDEICGTYEVLREVPLKNIEGMEKLDGEPGEYINNGARFDFVIAKDDHVCAIIEVDGAYHRSDPEVMINDDLKNQTVYEGIGEDYYNMRFLRLPTDGANESEMDNICSLLVSSYIGSEPMLIGNSYEIYQEDNEMRADLAEKLINAMNSCADSVDAELTSNGNAILPIWRKLDFRRTRTGGGGGPDRDDYQNAVFDDYYLTRYGYAYAFEYWVIYDALLRSYTGSEGNEPVLGVASFGCGSMLDAWAMAYARAYLEENRYALPGNLSLRYYGYDGAKWGRYFAGNPIGLPSFDGCQRLVNSCYGKAGINDFDANGAGPDIADVFNITTYEGYMSWKYYNVLMFSKILNELPHAVLNRTVDNIRYAAQQGAFARDEIYICISHSISSVDDTAAAYIDIAQMIVDAINVRGEYDYDGRIMESSPLFNHTDARGRTDGVILKINGGDPLHLIYGFADVGTAPSGAGYGCKIESLNADFSGDYVDAEYSECQGRCTDLKSRMSRTTSFAFQVIKLTRRSEV